MFKVEVIAGGIFRKSELVSAQVHMIMCSERGPMKVEF